MRFRATLQVSLAAAFFLSLTGCSSGDSNDSEGTAAGTPESSGNFCADFEEAGGSGAGLGFVQVWLAPEDVLADVQARLVAMDEVQGPSEVETEWTAVKTHYQDIATAFEAAGTDGSAEVGSDGETLVGKFSAESVELADEFEAVTDYYFATC